MHGMRSLLFFQAFLSGLIFWLISVLPSGVLANEAILITENTEQLNLASMSYYFEDHNGVLNVENIETEAVQGQFRPIAADYLNVGITGSVIWLKFDLRYLSYLGENLALWLLQVGHPPLDLVTLYAQDSEGEFIAVHSGDKYPFDLRVVAHPTFLFPLELVSGETNRFYLRVETSGSMQVPVKLWSSLAYLEYSTLENVLSGILLGVLLVMVAFHLIQFISVRDVCSLFCCFYLGCFLLYFLGTNGIGMALIWPDLPQINSATPFFMSLTSVVAVIFTRSYFRPGDSIQWLDWLFLLLIMAGLLIVPASLLIHYGIAARVVMAQVYLSLPLIITTGLYFWLFRGDRSAGYFTAAFVCLLMGGAVQSMMMVGYLDNTPLTANGIALGQAVQTLLLGVGLTRRIRQIREQLFLEEERKKALVERQNEHLLRGNQLKREYLQGISRELSKPIKKTARALEMFSSESHREIRQSLLQEARDCSQEMARIIDGLLRVEDFRANVANITQAPFHLRRQLELTENKVRVKVRSKKLDFSVCVDESVPDVLYGDSDKLMKALNYLIDNALDFTSKGQVAIVAKAELLPDSGECRLLLQVQDTGSGVPSGWDENIYKIFQQADPKRRASGHFGLGLPLCQHLVNRMGGYVRHDSNPGKGSCFELDITFRQCDL